MVDWKSIQDIAEDILYNDNDNGNDDDDDDDTEDTIDREIIDEEVAATTHSFPHNNYRQYVQRGGGAHCRRIRTEPQWEKREHTTTGVGYDNHDDRSTVRGEVRSFCCC